jgi:signal transduction histidine kinase
MILIVIIALVFSVGVNYFIQRYYYGNKIMGMKEVANSINVIYNTSDSEDEALNRIEYLGYMFEGKIQILDTSTNKVVFENKRLQYSEGVIIKEIVYKDQVGLVYETSFPVEGARWLIFIDQLESDKYAALQIPIVAIEDTISTLKAFLNILLIIATLVALALSFILSSNITRPIKELHRVARNIGNLKFNHYYQGVRQDELGELGQELNSISNKLESTINDLYVEIQKEKNIDLMRRRFVAQVSHELQTPISIISSYTEALTDGIVDEDEMIEYYQVIEEEADKMSHIIRDLLELSQLETNTLSFDFNEIHLRPFLSTLMERYRRVIEGKDLRFYYTDECVRDVVIQGDVLRLEQAVTNILNNAIKNSDDLITVDVYNEQEVTKITIINSGEPIEANDLTHLFESFYKGKSRNKSVGTGLGLAIASQIFDKHHIIYNVDNLEHGVCFTMRIKDL